MGKGSARVSINADFKRTKTNPANDLQVIKKTWLPWSLTMANELNQRTVGTVENIDNSQISVQYDKINHII